MMQLQKTYIGDLTILDEALMPDTQGDIWANLADKEYQGATE